MLLKHCISRRNWLLRGTILFGIIGFVVFGYYYQNALRGKVESLSKSFNWMKSGTEYNFHNSKSESSQSKSKLHIQVEKRFDSALQKNISVEKFDAAGLESPSYEVSNVMESTLASEVQLGFNEMDPVEKVPNESEQNEMDPGDKISSNESNLNSKEHRRKDSNESNGNLEEDQIKSSNETHKNLEGVEGEEDEEK